MTQQVTPLAHAKFAPSSAERWLSCTGSLILEANEPKETSYYAAEGTAAHELGGTCLIDETDPADYEGTVIEVKEKKETFNFLVDAEMIEHVTTYVNAVREYRDAGPCTMIVEERVDFSDIVGVPDQFGTADAIILTEDGELQVHDLKYGQGVTVDATNNKQLMMYALAAYHMYNGLLGDEIHTLRVCIHQPRVGSLSEWDFGLQELFDFEADVRDAAARVAEAEKFDISTPSKLEEFTKVFCNPTAKGCRFCKVRGKCTALERFNLEQVIDDFDPLDDDLTPQIEKAIGGLEEMEAEAMGKKYTPEALEMFDAWIKAVRARIDAHLLNGLHVPNWKVVAGKSGARKWTDKEEVEARLKKWRIKRDDMYKKDIISPTQAEKLFKKNHPKYWNQLQEFITAEPPKPVPAPMSDKREAIQVRKVEDDFEDITVDVSDLI